MVAEGRPRFEGHEVGEIVGRRAVEDATLSVLETLDLVVYVPIERPDRLQDPDLPRLRRRVDRVLREMFVDRTWGWTIPCLEVRGTVRQRADQVAAHVAARAASTPLGLPGT